ncbi:MAG: secretin and TonB N-terminal domain-containing protein [Candidatus Omnitrophota bacterium]
MKRTEMLNSRVFLVVIAGLFFTAAFAQDTGQQPADFAQAQEETQLERMIIAEPGEAVAISQNVTLDFNEADIRNVLKIISYKSGVNIVTTPEVIGNVTIRLVDVPWEKALDVILKTYGFGYERQGNIILVTKMENISKIQAEEPLRTEIFSLKFLDAQDAERALIPMISPRGKISILYTRGQKGWQFGTFKIGKEQISSQQLQAQEKATGMRSETVSIEKNAEGRTVSTKVDFETSIKSKTLIVTDTSFSLEKIRNFLQVIDKKPRQVSIETRIMEVNRDKLKDLGLDWGTGSSGASGYTTAPADIGVNKGNTMTLAGRSLASEFTPSVFGPKEGTSITSGLPGTYPYKAGLEVLFKKISGTQFEVILHALEEDVHTNTLSAPRILTLDNQEASILVGLHTPILSSTVTAGTAATGTGATVTQTLDYYQEIGIRLNVVPQISEEGYINMLIHPSVTSSTSSIDATSVASGITTVTSYPIIDVREAQTQVLMKDGETIVIGGLMKDVKSKEIIGIPFLSKIPFLGKAFTREIIDNSKIDLLIFITAHVVEDNEPLSDQVRDSEHKAEIGSLRSKKSE